MIGTTRKNFQIKICFQKRKSLQWIREHSLSPDSIESLATHETDVQPHVIEL